MTKNAQKAAWLKKRRAGIGASEAAAILGVHPHLTAFDVWASKVHGVSKDGANGEQLEIGEALESTIARVYARRTGRKVVNPGPRRLYQHLTEPLLLATPDRFVERKDLITTGILEIKATGFFGNQSWKEEPPLHVQVQVQQQMAVLGFEWASVACLLGARLQLVWFDVQRHDKFIANLIAKINEWWEKYVLGNEPPPIDGSERTSAIIKDLYPSESGATIDLPESVFAADAELEIVKSELGLLEGKKREWENTIKLAMGEASVGLLPNGVQYTYHNQARKGYIVEPSTFRVLRRKEGLPCLPQ